MEIVLKQRRGLTLIETSLGLTMILLVMLVVINLLPSSWIAMGVGEQKVYAANLAQSIIDEKRAGAWDQLQTGPIPDVILNGTTYRGTLDVDSSKPYLKKVTLRLEWDSGRGKQSLIRKASICNLPR